MEREITALKAQKKNPNRINVYLDGEFAFGLARIVAAWLHIGQRLAENDIQRLEEQDTLEVAFQRALRLIGYRSRSENEVRRKLTELGFAETVIASTIERLKENRLLSDEQFASEWIENRSTFRPRSKRMLAMELRQKGLADETIENALSDAHDDSSLAYQSGVKYAQRLAGVDWETFRKRLGGYLGRRGFDYATIAPILQQIWQEMHGDQTTLNSEEMDL